MKKLDELMEDRSLDLHWKHIEPKLCVLLGVVANHVGVYDENGHTAYPHDCFCNKKNIDKENVRISSDYLNFIIIAVSRAIDNERRNRMKDK